MANAKSRLKAPKSAATKGRRGISKRPLTRTKPASDFTRCPDDVVMKRPSNVICLTSEEKVQFALQNGHLIKDRITIKPPPKINPKRKPTKKSLKELKAKRLISCDGNINLKTRSRLKFIDNILKTELMIDDKQQSENGQKRTMKHRQNGQMGNNNNDLDLSDQNKSDSDSKTKSVKNKVSKPKSKSSKIHKSRKTIKKPLKSDVNKNSQVKPRQVTLSNGLVLTLTLLECDYCNKMFSSKATIRRHMYRHMKIKPHLCKKCGKKFSNKVLLQKHIDKNHVETTHLCNICDKTFTLEENLELHLASHVKNENAYKCIYCDKKFSYNVLLIQHEKQHLVTGRYQCTLCTMSFDCRNQLSVHMKSHLNIKECICQYCGKEFQRINSMRRHVQVSHGGHRIQCPICNKMLKGHLAEHMRTHEQKKPHECDMCGQCFTQSTQLTVHKRSHTGDRPYSCRICKRPFSHSNALMLHIRRHTGEKPFQCAMCPLQFSQLPHMKAHMRNIHGKENVYKCSKCNEFFKMKSEMASHAKTCKVGDRELTFEEKIQASVTYEEVEVESPMTLTRMRFLLALLFTMITTKEKLKFLGFNKRLIDDLLEESLEAMGQIPCKDDKLQPVKRLRTNIQLLLNGTVPKDLMAKFKKEQKTTEELLELLTNEKKKDE